ncbi:uncharacterized protein KY384_005777 [Bacidia gigantensis]|uniref:uncharacterized protein n=1 Tax=Bacidia gigantensis TaxID=2732470 RepID=UPI001D03C11F|nr:uncharacterized protein KY384_005777 [Bacidia gigantensis]KAG8529142.1 hypothetical protein KY384_005777 [Bacidia gigantensis]
MAASSGGNPEMEEIQDYGLTQVYSPIGGGKVDIVFVHGLNGHPKKTWTAEKSKLFWPAQLLPPILEESKARILVYGYDATVASFTDGVSKDKIHNHAESLVASLAANRNIRRAAERPIIFVAHSLGGLVVKRALIYSEDIKGSHTEHLRSIYVSTYGILFLGTPHRGSDIAKWGSLLESICRGVMPSGLVDSNPALVDALKRENETLQVIDRQFIQLISRFRVYFFHEGKKTNLGKLKMDMIVDEESASPNVQDVERSVIQQDHSHMCKFESDSSPGFDLVAEALMRYSRDAPNTIVNRWQQERDESLTRKRYWLDENTPDALKVSPKTDTSVSNTPGKTPLALPGTENQRLYDQIEVEEVDDKEMVDVTHQYEFGIINLESIADFLVSVDSSQIIQPKPAPKTDVKDTATNTPASSNSPKPSDPYFIVPPGFRPNSFFVGMAKELLDLDKHLFDKSRRSKGSACVLLHGQPGGGKTHLARQYVNKNKKRYAGGIFWVMSKSVQELHHSFWEIKQKVIARDCPEYFDNADSKDWVHSVKAWFESRQDWLLVFDGVLVEKDEDATELNNYVPDSRNSSIIFISRAKNLQSFQRLLRPFPIKVGSLKEDDAQKLLIKMVNPRKVTDADRKRARELIQRVGGLPLAIGAISRRIADTGEPLAKFKLSYTAISGLDNTYNQILDDLLRLGHNEAWNLINILCWFGQNIPVEMVHLGLRILRARNVEVKTREEGGFADLNNTLSILLRYALLERNEPESDKGSASSSRDSLMEPEPIDMLKIHTVVQDFCCESLNSRRMLPQWLGYAVNLFSYSYHEADTKMKRRTEAPRVSDYRYYLVHGQRLWDHSWTYQGSNQNLEDIREVLQPILNMINEEIHAREPTSSQESLAHGIFQISIFDRTSSSSDSAPSVPGPPTPNHRPTPPPLAHETIFGIPKDKPMDSPASMGTASPGIRPKIVGQSPVGRVLEHEDKGYESDHESHDMRRNPSETTARPTSRPRAPTAGSYESGWPVVQSPRNSRQSRYRDLGSYRPMPVKAQVSRQSVSVSVGEVQENIQHRRNSSPAKEALKEVQNRSPPSSVDRVTSFLKRPFTSQENRPTWANIAAGKKPSQSTNNDSHVQPSSTSAGSRIFGLGKSNANTKPRQSSASSPLATEFLPRGPDTGDTQRMDGDFTLYSSDDPDTAVIGRPPANTLYQSNMVPRGTPQPQPILYPPFQSTAVPPPLGPNPAPLPYDNNMITTSQRPRPVNPIIASNIPLQAPYTNPIPSTISTAETFNLSQSLPTIHQPYFYYTPQNLPSGYTSQPMSRDTSHQSHASLAETEPPPYPPGSISPYTHPQISPHSVSPATAPPTAAHCANPRKPPQPSKPRPPAPAYRATPAPQQQISSHPHTRRIR